MTQAEINRTEWADPRSWRGGWLGIYHAPRDTRVLVPKRNPGMGWTVNTARPAGLALAVGLPALALGVLLVAALTDE